MKWMRQYRMEVFDEDSGETLIISNPITIRFTVSRRTASTLNVLQADLYNLDQNTRNFLFQEQWVTRNKTITFSGGYDTLSILFMGTLWSGYSYRDGSDIITSIECKSEFWELDTTTVYETINPSAGNLTVKDVLTTIAGKFEGLSIGAIGDYPEKLLRPVTVAGNAWNLFKKYSNYTGFIDNGRIYALRRNEVVEGELLTIDASTGLLASPQRIDTANIQIQVLFEPRIVMGQNIELGSGVNQIYNGQYKVFGIQHTGIISDAVNGDLRTIIDLFVGGEAFKVVQNG